MSAKNAAELGQRVLASRPSASRKLLARKVRQKSAHGNAQAPLESNFPQAIAQDASAGTIRNARNVQQQKLRLGDIQPNSATVPAVIAAIVAERGELSRTELVALMHGTDFPHPAARPQDKSWCQGYVAGAIRNGFLALVPREAAAVIEPSLSSTEER